MKTAAAKTTVKTASTTKIMIVEDESIIALDIKRSLSRLGYAITGVAASGEAALLKIKDNRPHLVLMDIHLKGEMDGIQTSKIIKSDFQLPIVYLTANADSSTFQSAQTTDPHAYLLKPFDEKSLGIAIEVALNQHRKTQAIKASEYWYANAFQCMNEAVISTDSQGSIIFMNALAEEMSGVTLSEAIDRPLVDILRLQRKIQQIASLPPQLQLQQSDSIASILESVLNGSDTIPLPQDIQLVNPALSFTPIEGSATSIRAASGEITGSLFIFRSQDVVKKQKSARLFDSRAETEASVVKEPLKLNQEQTIPLEDVQLIDDFTRSFIKGEPVLLSTANLVASSGEGATTLSARETGTIITVKPIDGKQTAIVDQTSEQWEIIRHTLIENSFFPISRRTNGTCYFQHRVIPEDCQIFHTTAIELWETWYGKACPDLFNQGALQVKLPRENIVVLRRGSWYHIQNLMQKDEALRIKTVAGEIYISLDDLLIWGAKSTG
ncbi:MAG: response regulator [Phormidesmis sp.]